MGMLRSHVQVVFILSHYNHSLDNCLAVFNQSDSLKKQFDSIPQSNKLLFCYYDKDHLYEPMQSLQLAMYKMVLLIIFRKEENVNNKRKYNKWYETELVYAS